VSDTGRGTARPVIDNIFNPFLDRIKSHGGFISVYSDLGVGTTFQIFLPATVMADPDVSTPGTNGAK
jgi:signal transduction histidine kinase